MSVKSPNLTREGHDTERYEGQESFYTNKSLITWCPVLCAYQVPLSDPSLIRLLVVSTPKIHSLQEDGLSKITFSLAPRNTMVHIQLLPCWGLMVLQAAPLDTSLKTHQVHIWSTESTHAFISRTNVRRAECRTKPRSSIWLHSHSQVHQISRVGIRCQYTVPTKLDDTH